MDLSEVILVRLPLWSLFAAPIVFGLCIAAILLRRFRISFKGATVSYAIVAGVLLAPMPVGMWLALVPNGYLLFGGLKYYAKIWDWFVVSMPATVFVCFAAISLARMIRRHMRCPSR